MSVAPAAKPQVATAADGKPAAPPQQGWGREFLETITFVVVLVLLLKAVVAEAFVIPTGSMATTLFGDHYQVKCPTCHYVFTLNNSPDPRAGPDARPLQWCTCPNCLQNFSPQGEALPVGASEAMSGDKVLVLKPPYDYGKPQRFDVIVFKYPGHPMYLVLDNNFERDLDGFPHLQEIARGRLKGNEGLLRAGGPQENYVARNFIKRLWGLPGEKLAIQQGKVFLCVQEGGKETLQLIKKPPHVALQIRRLVNDNDHLHPKFGSHWMTFSSDAKTTLDPFTEETAAPWKSEDNGKSFVATDTAQHQWLRYRHRKQPDSQDPTLITNALDYNGMQGDCWLGDLMLEAEVDVQESKGELILELTSGGDNLRAICDLATGQVTLQALRIVTDDRANVEVKQVAKWQRQTPLHNRGKHQVRFANVDNRLTLWVDGKNQTWEPCDYPRAADDEYGPRYADLLPASIGAKGAKVAVRKVKLWRDTYYTRGRYFDNNHQLHSASDPTPEISSESLPKIREKTAQVPGQVTGDAAARLPRALIAAHAARLEREARGPGKVAPCYYPLQHPLYHPSDRFGPDEHFALGDNSSNSKDSRAWGQIPERLLVGKAITIYWPWTHWKIIR